MTTITKIIDVDAPADAVWDAVSDFGAVHTRFAPGFVTNVELIPGARMVTFGNGMVVKEVIVDSDDTRRRLVWTVESERLTHHNGVMQVEDAGEGRSRALWTADVLPHAAAETVGPMMEMGLAAMKTRLEG